MVNRPIEIDGIKYFKCRKCGEVKPLNKCYFHINTMFSTGFNSKCKSCVREEVNKKPKVKYITRAELEEENKELYNKRMGVCDRVYELEEENKKLKSDLSECECSMHFENDEVGYRKRECKKLKEELSKYKKQYEHSMGEDDELIYEEGLYD